MATVELKNVTKRFGAHEVIHGIDITVPAWMLVRCSSTTASG